MNDIDPIARGVIARMESDESSMGNGLLAIRTTGPQHETMAIVAGRLAEAGNAVLVVAKDDDASRRVAEILSKEYPRVTTRRDNLFGHGVSILPWSHAKRALVDAVPARFDIALLDNFDARSTHLAHEIAKELGEILQVVELRTPDSLHGPTATTMTDLAAEDRDGVHETTPATPGMGR